MPVSLYMDHHVPKAITMALRLRGVDVLTSYEDGTDQLDDEHLLQRAHELKRALFTQDDDLLEEAAKCYHAEKPFSGVIYAHQLRVTIGVCVQDLEIIAKSSDESEMENQVIYLPL
jgi:predicted nuclease of predicted toxin-antitoxin system